MNTPNWQYWNPVRVVFESGALDRLDDHLDCRRAVLITTPGFRRRGHVARIEAALGSRLVGVIDDVQPNPDLRDVDRQGAAVRELEPDMLIALGGGSAMDTAKGLARLLSQPAGSSLGGHFRAGETFTDQPALAVTAIPTTAGTGAEVTPFGTIWDFEQGKKYSVTGPDLFARVALLDPELTLGLPDHVTISSGLDALSHALESCWNRAASPVTLGLVTQSVSLTLAALPRLRMAPEDRAARARMMEASLLAGLAISQTRTALAHSISYPLTTEFDLPHGFACSFTLPALMRFNREADDGRIAALARRLGYDDVEAFAVAIEGLFNDLDLGGYLQQWVPDRESALQLSGRMFTPGRADNNLRSASGEHVEAILGQSLAANGVGATR